MRKKRFNQLVKSVHEGAQILRSYKTTFNPETRVFTSDGWNGKFFKSYGIGGRK